MADLLRHCCSCNVWTGVEVSASMISAASKPSRSRTCQVTCHDPVQNAVTVLNCNNATGTWPRWCSPTSCTTTRCTSISLTHPGPLVTLCLITLLPPCSHSFQNDRYMAPEVFRHELYNHKVDQYAFAMICYQLFQGLPPFYTLDPVQAARAAAQHSARPEWSALNR